MSKKFPDSLKKITIKIIDPIETSYEIIWAIARVAPKKEYFDWLNQPAEIILNTFNDETLYKIKTL